jgi:hypothetical protein
MRHRTLWIIAVASVSIWACSTPPAANDGLGDDVADDDDNDTSNDDGNDENKDPPPTTSTVDSGTTTPDTGAGTCSRAQGVDACYDCCDALHPGGEDTYFQAFFDCACQPSVCGDECGSTACSRNGPNPVDGDACDTCLDQADACYDEANTACDANAACVAGSQCIVDSQCDP